MRNLVDPLRTDAPPTQYVLEKRPHVGRPLRAAEGHEQDGVERPHAPLWLYDRRRTAVIVLLYLALFWMRRILVTNDDGVHSEGIHALAGALAALGEVLVVAPQPWRRARSVTP